MKRQKIIFFCKFAAIGMVLVGCVSDHEMEAYYHDQCLSDRVTFETFKPGSPDYHHCLDLYRSGLGGYDNDLHSGEGLGQFAD